MSYSYSVSTLNFYNVNDMLLHFYEHQGRHKPLKIIDVIVIDDHISTGNMFDIMIKQWIDTGTLLWQCIGKGL